MSDRHPHHSSHSSGAPADEAPRFLDDPRNVDRLLMVLYVACALVFAVDFVIHRHVVHPWEGVPGFYPVYGFVGIVLLVLLAKQLRRVVMRDEDYYDAA